MFNVVLGYIADQRYRGPWEIQKQLTSRPTDLYGLTVTYKGAGTVWVQLHDAASLLLSDNEPEEYPLTQNQVLSVTNRRYLNGLRVQAVTEAEGGDEELIETADIKIQADYMLRAPL